MNANILIVCLSLLTILIELVPAHAEKELRNLYLALSELLRHFWHSFPPTTPELESKAVRMHEALQRFEVARLHPFEVNYNISKTFVQNQWQFVISNDTHNTIPIYLFCRNVPCESYHQLVRR